MERSLFLGLAVTAAFALALPAAVLAKAEQASIEIVEETFLLELDDPCTGVALHGEATESGHIRLTDLGDQGQHERVYTKGIVDLYDAEDSFVGTWTYAVRFINAYPPDAQGHVTYWLRGPIVFADGSRAQMHWVEQQTFGKGDVLKRQFIRASCGGA